MSLFASSKRATAVQPDTKLRIQTSLEGVVRTILWGRQRTTPNLVWYGDFQAIPQSSGGGGKGGAAGGGATSYNYAASLILALCEGPASATGVAWTNSTATTLGALNLSFIPGSYTQTPWGYLLSRHADQAAAYRGTAYVAAAPFDLGGSASMPSVSVEVTGGTDAPIAGLPDAAADFVVRDFLTSPWYGAGFPADRVGDMALWRSFTIAAGLVVSPMLTAQGEARSTLNEWLTACNGAAVWSGGVLNVLPYGDVAVVGNGYSYDPPGEPLFDLTDDDFQTSQGGNPNSTATGSSNDPVQGVRRKSSDFFNAYPVEFLDRRNNYNPKLIYWKDDASIATFGLREADKKTLHMFCTEAAALTAAEMIGARESAKPNTYAVTVGQHLIRLDPQDIVTITDVGMGLDRQWCRVVEITENQDASLTLVLEEVAFGNGAPATHTSQPSLGFSADIDAPVAALGTVIAWEPTYALANGLEVWIAAAGTDDWASCEIWLSTDGESYRYQDTLRGVSRLGMLTTSLPAIASLADGRTIDDTHTLTVDMSPSGMPVLGANLYDMLDANTLCYVGGEYLSYANSALSSGDIYAVSRMSRGLFDTDPVGHPAGSPFVRLALGTYVRVPYTPDRLGQTLFVKALGVNAYGGGRQSLADVTAIAHTITGLALSGPLPNPTALTTSLVAGLTALHWSEVSDFRSPVYEIRVGADWTSAQVYTRLAHPPFLLPSNGTWWIAAYVNPAPGIEVYSGVPSSLAVTAVTENAVNVIAAWEEATTGWTGTRGAGLSVAGSSLVTAASAMTAIYEIPSSHIANAGRACACNTILSWSASAAVPTDVLSLTDWLNTQNVLGIPLISGFAIRPLIAIAPDSGAFGPWQTYRPGSYFGQRFKFGLEVTQTDPGAVVAISSFRIVVEAPTRTDHFVNLSIPSGGSTVQFRLDGTSSPVAFVAGPGGATQPSVTGAIIDAQSGDRLSLTGIGLTQVSVQILNGGTGVARAINLEIRGY